MLRHTDIQQCSREDNAKFNLGDLKVLQSSFLGFQRAYQKSNKIFPPEGTMLPSPRYTGFVINVRF